ncbi:MAG: IS21 family transposase, partial [Bacteroidota bacterium]|nr:IS21 family transposase [Bacteroidota bacterium]
MKGVKVYHTIKVLSDRGFSIRSISKNLGISKTTVLKYLKITGSNDLSKLISVQRVSEFDQYNAYLKDQLEAYPSMRITKLYRKLKEKYPSLNCGKRALHNYVQKMSLVKKGSSKRYYEPIETSPGLQVQVDPGESKVKFEDGNNYKIYFVVFIFSFSRMKYVYFQDRPFNTLDFIKSHTEAFTFFGYKSKEYVYDQTKLVVINERYREVWLNEKFHQFALENNFTPQVCEGYDPESKGKVERAVKEVKEDFLYGDKFLSLADIRIKSTDWLSRVNNEIHSITNESPSALFKEEITLCNIYKSKELSYKKRLVDKVSLLSFLGNKYSVPQKYQNSFVNVIVKNKMLLVFSIDEDIKIAEHQLGDEKGKRFINNNHYRNYSDKLFELKKKIKEESKDIKNFDEVIDRIEKNNPKILRDQIRGLLKIVRNNSVTDLEQFVPIILNLTFLTA